MIKSTINIRGGGGGGLIYRKNIGNKQMVQKKNKEIASNTINYPNTGLKS